MGRTSDSDSDERAIYRGEVVITPLDTDDLEGVEDVVEDLTDLEEGEALYVSPHGEEGIEVAKLKKEIE